MTFRTTVVVEQSPAAAAQDVVSSTLLAEGVTAAEIECAAEAEAAAEAGEGQALSKAAERAAEDAAFINASRSAAAADISSRPSELLHAAAAADATQTESEQCRSSSSSRSNSSSSRNNSSSAGRGRRSNSGSSSYLAIAAGAGRAGGAKASGKPPDGGSGSQNSSSAGEYKTATAGVNVAAAAPISRSGPDGGGIESPSSSRSSCLLVPGAATRGGCSNSSSVDDFSRDGAATLHSSVKSSTTSTQSPGRAEAADILVPAPSLTSAAAAASQRHVAAAGDGEATQASAFGPGDASNTASHHTPAVDKPRAGAVAAPLLRSASFSSQGVPVEDEGAERCAPLSSSATASCAAATAAATAAAAQAPGIGVVSKRPGNTRFPIRGVYASYAAAAAAHRQKSVAATQKFTPCASSDFLPAVSAAPAAAGFAAERSASSALPGAAASGATGPRGDAASGAANGAAATNEERKAAAAAAREVEPQVLLQQLASGEADASVYVATRAEGESATPAAAIEAATIAAVAEEWPALKAQEETAAAHTGEAAAAAANGAAASVEVPSRAGATGGSGVATEDGTALLQQSQQQQSARKHVAADQAGKLPYRAAARTDATAAAATVSGPGDTLPEGLLGGALLAGPPLTAATADTAAASGPGRVGETVTPAASGDAAATQEGTMEAYPVRSCIGKGLATIAAAAADGTSFQKSESFPVAGAAVRASGVATSPEAAAVVLIGEEAECSSPSQQEEAGFGNLSRSTGAPAAEGTAFLSVAEGAGAAPGGSPLVALTEATGAGFPGFAAKDGAEATAAAAAVFVAKTATDAQGGDKEREAGASPLQAPSAEARSERSASSSWTAGVKKPLPLQGFGRGTGTGQRRVVVLRRGAANLADFSSAAAGDATRAAAVAAAGNSHQKEDQDPQQQLLPRHGESSASQRAAESSRTAAAAIQHSDECGEPTVSFNAQGQLEAAAANGAADASRRSNADQNKDEIRAAAAPGEPAAAAPPNKTIKTLEEREREYNELRARIFAVDPSAASSSSFYSSRSSSAASSGASWRREGAASSISPSAAAGTSGGSRGCFGGTASGRKSDNRTAGTTPPPRIKGLSRYAANDHLDPAFSRSAFPPLAVADVQQQQQQHSQGAVSPPVRGSHNSGFPVYEGTPAAGGTAATSNERATAGRKREEEGRHGGGRERRIYVSPPTVLPAARRSSSSKWFVERAAAGLAAPKNKQGQQNAQQQFPGAMPAQEQSYYQQFQQQQLIWQQQALLQEQRYLQPYQQYQQQLLHDEQNWNCYYDNYFSSGLAYASASHGDFALCSPAAAAAAPLQTTYDRSVARQQQGGYLPCPLFEPPYSTTGEAQSQAAGTEKAARDILSSASSAAAVPTARTTAVSPAAAAGEYSNPRQAAAFLRSAVQQHQQRTVPRRTSSVAAPAAENRPDHSRWARRSSAAAGANTSFQFAHSASSPSSSTWLEPACSRKNSRVSSAVIAAHAALEISLNRNAERSLVGTAAAAAAPMTPVPFAGAAAADAAAPTADFSRDSRLSICSSSRHGRGGGGGGRNSSNVLSRGEYATNNRRQRYAGTPTATPHSYSSTCKRETNEWTHKVTSSNSSTLEETVASHAEMHSTGSSSQGESAFQADKINSNNSGNVSRHPLGATGGGCPHLRSLRPRPAAGGSSHGNDNSSNYSRGGGTSVGNGRWQPSGSCTSSSSGALSSSLSSSSSNSGSNAGGRDRAAEAGGRVGTERLQHRRPPSYLRGGCSRNYYHGASLGRQQQSQFQQLESQQLQSQQLQQPALQWEAQQQQLYWQQQQQTYWEQQQQSYWQQQQFYWQQQQQQQRRQHWSWQQGSWQRQQQLQWQQQQQEQLQWQQQQQLQWQQHLQWQQELQWQHQLRQVHAAPVPPPPSDDATQQQHKGQTRFPHVQGSDAPAAGISLQQGTVDVTTAAAGQQESASAGSKSQDTRQQERPGSLDAATHQQVLKEAICSSFRRELSSDGAQVQQHIEATRGRATTASGRQGGIVVTEAEAANLLKEEGAVAAASTGVAEAVEHATVYGTDACGTHVDTAADRQDEAETVRVGQEQAFELQAAHEADTACPGNDSSSNSSSEVTANSSCCCCSGSKNCEDLACCSSRSGGQNESSADNKRMSVQTCCFLGSGGSEPGSNCSDAAGAHADDEKENRTVSGTAFLSDSAATADCLRRRTHILCSGCSNRRRSTSSSQTSFGNRRHVSVSTRTV